MTPAEPIRYRRLPGRLRGLVLGASLWMGPDHILAVRSYRFREEYKRFYLRDIQAIVVAHAARYHVSTPMMLAGLVWLIVYGLAAARVNWAGMVFGTGALLALIVWLYLSAKASCRVRIYTAVSGEDLPSLYRRRTAQRFLAQLEPRIGEAQGVIEGSWVEALKQRPDAGSALVGVHRAPPPQGATRSWATDLLLGALFASAIVDALLIRSSARALIWTSYGCSLLEVAAAAAIFAQHYRGKLRKPMQRVAIAALVVMGVMFYVRPLSVGVMAGIDASKGRSGVVWDVDETGGIRPPVIFRQIDTATSVLLGCIGLWILLRADDERT